jgi:hypothetical protein
VLTNFAQHDGAIACIPAAAWVPDSEGEVGAVGAHMGIRVFNEAFVNLMVVNSNISDNAAINPGAIGDANGLAVDCDAAEPFVFQWGNQAYALDHLLISGTTLTGCGVISTVGGGTIAVVNGCALAAAVPVPTLGRRMGLAYTPNPATSSAENLECLEEEPCYFVLETPEADCGALPGNFSVHIGTNLPVAFVWLGYGQATLPVRVSHSLDFSAFAPGTECFPELYQALLGLGGFGASFSGILGPYALTAAGDGGFATVNFAGVPAVAGGILFQGIALAYGTIQLSTPGTISD